MKDTKQAEKVSKKVVPKETLEKVIDDLKKAIAKTELECKIKVDNY